MRAIFAVSTALSLFAVACATSSYVRARDGVSDIDPGDPIERITVRLDVVGELTDEPVSLDLGVGFPFLLVAGDEGHGASLPVGAMPMESTRTNRDAAVELSFTFGSDGDSAADRLRLTQQLMHGLRISDISRIGFASSGFGDWELAGYTVSVNGQLLVSNNNAGIRHREVVDTLQFELADIGLQIAPLEAEAVDLKALAEAQLATDGDRVALAALDAQLAQLREQKSYVEGQLAGAYPWYQDAEFDPEWRQQPHVSTAVVRVMTNSHLGADTQNFVYFGTGGRKYVLNPAGQPLTGLSGSQTFQLDLLAGPLTAADLRGFSVGMLGSASPFGEAPDRWHPQRILVEIDGQYVYDSEDSPIDRLSLEAIRVIPPAHFDGDGVLVTNSPTSRECFVWEAGHGAGLDLLAGGPLPLPPPDDDSFPKPESPPPPGSGAAPGDAGFPSDPFADSGGGGSWNNCPPFPGEDGGGWNDPGGGGWNDPGGNWPDPGGGGPGGNWPGPGGNGGWNSPGGGWQGNGPPPWLGWIISWLIKELGVIPPGVTPPPWGTPFQIKDVDIVAPWKSGDEYTIRWSVSGDESQIDHYEGFLVGVRPDRADPYPAAEILSLGKVMPGVRELKHTGVPQIFNNDELSLFAPRIVAIPKDPMEKPHERTGPARANYSPGWWPSSLTLKMSPGFAARDGSGKSHPGPVSTNEPTDAVSRAVWVAGQLQSHNAILFDELSPAYTVIARPQPGDSEVGLVFTAESLSGRHEVHAIIGFQGHAPAGNEVEVEMQCLLLPPNAQGATKVFPPVSVTLTDPAGGAAVPARVIRQTIDPAAVPFANGNLFVWFNLKTASVDPNYPPTLIGVTLLPLP